MGDDSAYSEYMQLIKARLDKDKFEIQENQGFDNMKVDLFAYRTFDGWRIAYRAVCGVARFDEATPENVRAFSRAFYDFASNYKTVTLFTCFTYPVIVAQSFADQVKAFVQTFNGKHFHGGYWYIEHPILVELSTSTITHFQKSGFFGALPEHTAIGKANQYFSFEGKG